MNSKKVLVLFSGGLDSLLAVAVLRAQGLTVDAVCFVSNFFDCRNAKRAAEANGIKIREVVDIGSEILDMVKDPEAKKGKNLNPCIDCHSLMIKKARQYIESGEYAIIATGEVLGQRPFSQTKRAMEQIEKNAGIRVLRPLSALKMEPTEPEQKGWIDRKKLLGIEGRGRKKQIELAINYNLKEYESPAGGCLLTQESFSQRLSDMIKYWPDCEPGDVELLKHGRPIWFTLKDKEAEHYILAVIGRRAEDNVSLYYGAEKGDLVMSLKELEGPLTLVRSKSYAFPFEKMKYKIKVPVEENDFESAGNRVCKKEERMLEYQALLTAWYKAQARGRTVTVEVKKKQ
jgi:predicted subunit of tRNA(5-methylaminomethyl-2-thiouridylate) methyltransferase